MVNEHSQQKFHPPPSHRRIRFGKTLDAVLHGTGVNKMHRSTLISRKTLISSSPLNLISQTSTLIDRVNDRYLLIFDRNDTGMMKTIFNTIAFTSSAGEIWLLRPPTGHCFSGRLGNYGPLVLVPNGCRFAHLRQLRSAGLLADFTLFCCSPFDPSCITVSVCAIEVLKWLLTLCMFWSTIVKSIQNAVVHLMNLKYLAGCSIFIAETTELSSRRGIRTDLKSATQGLPSNILMS